MPEASAPAARGRAQGGDLAGLGAVAATYVFFLIWARRQNWTVPEFHIRMCHWLETVGPVGVLMVFRGAAKSTILAVYNAWRYYLDPTYRILHQGDQDGTAFKTSRDTRSVLQRHPLTQHLTELSGEVKFWWAPGSNDQRNPSMQAAGITSNVTSSRADEIQNDDVEVPRNITTPDLREKMRHRLQEQTFILVPGGRKLFIGTPHTHDSIYDEKIEGGAEVLKIPLFDREYRIEDKIADLRRFPVPFEPDYVFAGIGQYCRLMKHGLDYFWKDGSIEFAEPPGQIIDCYADCVWPERFTRDDLLLRRKETRTLNGWDSQYQLHSKPTGDIRLDPERIRPYEIEPVIRRANGQPGMWLGSVRIVGASCRWDVALGKVNGDDSVLSVVLTDEAGQLYWHRAVGLTGEIAEFSGQAKNDAIVGGQVMQIRAVVEELQLTRVVVEVNGPGGFAAALLKRALRGLQCGVTEDFATANKQQRILEAFEAPMSAGFLWAHTSVLDGPAWDQLIQFNPLAKNQADDFIDSGAGAIADTPVRIGHSVRNLTAAPREHWSPGAGTFDATLET